MTDDLILEFELFKPDELETYLESSVCDFHSMEDKQFRSAYAEKLSKNAFFLVGRDSEGKIGCMTAFYANKAPTIFLTHVHTFDDYKRKGYCYKMLERIFQKYKDSSFNSIKLEVYKHNDNAVSAYSKFGFVISGENDTKYTMIREF